MAMRFGNRADQNEAGLFHGTRVHSIPSGQKIDSYCKAEQVCPLRFGFRRICCGWGPVTGECGVGINQLWFCDGDLCAAQQTNPTVRWGLSRREAYAGRWLHDVSRLNVSSKDVVGILPGAVDEG